MRTSPRRSSPSTSRQPPPRASPNAPSSPLSADTRLIPLDAGTNSDCRDFDVYTRCAPITFCTHAPCGNGRRGRVRSGRGNRRSQFATAPRPPSSPLRKKAVSACWQAKALHVQGSTVRGRGSDSSGTVGVSCMNGSYLSQSTCQCARRRERSASFGSKPRGAIACFGVCVDLCRVVHLLAGPPWRPNGRQGSGFDSPWQGGGGTTSLRAPAVVKLLVQRGGPGV